METEQLSELITREEAQRIAELAAEAAIQKHLSPPMYGLSLNKRLVTYDLLREAERNAEVALNAAQTAQRMVEELWAARLARWWEDNGKLLVIVLVLIWFIFVMGFVAGSAAS